MMVRLDRLWLARRLQAPQPQELNSSLRPIVAPPALPDIDPPSSAKSTAECNRIMRHNETEPVMIAPSPRPSLGQTIRARRMTLGMSQEALAMRVRDLGSELTQADVSRIELGKVELPRRRRLEHLAAALELSLGELLEASGWVGAVECFITGDTAAPPRASSAPAHPSPDLRPAMLQPPLRWPAPAASDTLDTMDAIFRLRTAIARAQEPVTRAARLLEACQATALLWDPVLPRPRDAGSNAESPRMRSS